MDNLLIVDGNNLLFRMFYGMPAKIYNKSGQTIHATIGFISYVLKQIKLYGISAALVVFDCDGSAERKGILPEYKANRVQNWDELPDDEVPFSEEEKILKCLDYLKIAHMHSENMEADDLIANVTKDLKSECNIIISSFDSDFFQLIDDNVSVLRYKGKNSVLYDKKYFYEKFGFSPENYALFKSLTGDSSDNIKGVAGIGPKRAAEYINAYIAEEKKKTTLSACILNAINENEDLIKKNLQLIEFKNNSEFIFDIESFYFNCEHAKKTNSEVLSACNIFD